MEEFYSVLERCPLFAGIPIEDVVGMLGCMGARITRAKQGEFIFREGDTACFLGIVLSGSVRLFREDYYGNRSILAHIGPTQLFGESFAFSDARALPVSVVADEDSQILFLDSQRISACCANACDHHNRVIFNLLRVVATKNLVLHQKIYVTSKRSTREKLMAYLTNQAKLHNSDCFTIPYDRQELADYLEVDRSGLSAQISKLRREGILESEKRQFKLHKSADIP